MGDMSGSKQEAATRSRAHSQISASCEPGQDSGSGVESGHLEVNPSPGAFMPPSPGYYTSPGGRGIQVVQGRVTPAKVDKPGRYLTQRIYWLCAITDLILRCTWIITLLPTHVV